MALQKAKQGGPARTAKARGPISEARRSPGSRAAQKRHAVAAELPVPAGPPGVLSSRSESSDVSELFEAAVEELRRVAPALNSYEMDRQEWLTTLLATAYVLSRTCQNHPQVLADLLARNKVKRRKDTPHHKLVIRAVLTAARTPTKKGTEHEWAQVLFGLECGGVEPSHEAVAAWLTTPVVIDGCRVVGFSRAEAAVSASKGSKEERAILRREHEAEAESEFAGIAATAAHSPLGTVVMPDDASVPSGFWLSLNNGAVVLADLGVDQKKLRAITLKHGGWNVS